VDVTGISGLRVLVNAGASANTVPAKHENNDFLKPRTL